MGGHSVKINQFKNIPMFISNTEYQSFLIELSTSVLILHDLIPE